MICVHFVDSQWSYTQKLGQNEQTDFLRFTDRMAFAYMSRHRARLPPFQRNFGVNKLVARANASSDLLRKQRRLPISARRTTIRN